MANRQSAPTTPSRAGITNIHRREEIRHSPYPQRERTPRSRSPSTPSKQPGEGTSVPLFLPNSRESSANPGSPVVRAPSETRSLSSDATFHSIDEEDLFGGAQVRNFHSASKSKAERNWVKSSTPSRKRTRQDIGNSAPELESELMKETKKNLVARLLFLESELELAAKRAKTEDYNKSRIDTLKGEKEALNSKVMGLEGRLKMQKKIFDEEANRITLKEQELSKKALDELKRKHKVDQNELTIKHSDTTGRDAEKHTIELDNMKDFYEKELRKQDEKYKQACTAISSANADGTKLAQKVASIQQDNDKLTKLMRDRDALIKKSDDDKARLNATIKTLEKTKQDLTKTTAQQEDTIASLTQTKSVLTKRLAQAESSTAPNQRPIPSAGGHSLPSDDPGTSIHQDETPSIVNTANPNHPPSHRSGPTGNQSRPLPPLPGAHRSLNDREASGSRNRSQTPFLTNRNPPPALSAVKEIKKRYRPGLRNKILRKAELQDESDTGEEDGSSDEENPPANTDKSEFRKLAQALLKLAEEPTSSKSHSRKPTMGRGKRSSHNVDDPEERRTLLARLRLYFQEKLKYEEDEDFQSHEAATDEQVEDFVNGVGNGPNLADLHFHCAGGRTSPWNKEAIRMMTEDLPAHMEEDDEYEWPSRDYSWWQKEMWNRFSRLMAIWRQAQRVMLSDGEFEDDETLDSRLDEMRNTKLRLQRRRTRRITKYDTRVRVCAHAVKTRTQGEDPHGDLEMWTWLQKALGKYGPDAMSSDDSDMEGGEEVYYTTHQPWRRAAVIKYFDWLDDERRDPQQAAHSKKGKRPGKRYRTDKTSARGPVKELPLALYEPGWFNELHASERGMYGASRTRFKWMKIYLQPATSGSRKSPGIRGRGRAGSVGPAPGLRRQERAEDIMDES